MKSRQEIIEYCLGLPGAYLDYPFGEDAPVLRHRGNRKIFGLFLQHQGRPMLNLKCEPMQADFWRSVYRDVIPGYHMNKAHWNSVVLGGDIPEGDLLAMIQDSYRLTAPRRAGKKR